jgi:hypothetical protein
LCFAAFCLAGCLQPRAETNVPIKLTDVGCPVTTPNGPEADKICPAIYWYSMLKIPGAGQLASQRQCGTSLVLEDVKPCNGCLNVKGGVENQRYAGK